VEISGRHPVAIKEVKPTFWGVGGQNAPFSNIYLDMICQNGPFAYFCARCFQQPFLDNPDALKLKSDFLSDKLAPHRISLSINPAFEHPYPAIIANSYARFFSCGSGLKPLALYYPSTIAKILHSHVQTSNPVGCCSAWYSNFFARPGSRTRRHRHSEYSSIHAWRCPGIGLPQLCRHLRAGSVRR